MREDKLLFISLGGLEEIGLNCYLYGITNKNKTDYLMIDLGIGFKDNKFNFLDTFIPDLSLVKNPKQKLKALLITHGHEDHIGAIEYHYEFLKDIPIYATPFTSTLIKNKLKYHNINTKNIIDVNFGQKYKIDNFLVTFIPIEHSIPQSAMILIEVQNKLILHSGDFKINPSTFNPASIKNFLPNKVDYLFCDSTNSTKNMPYLPEMSIMQDLEGIISASKQAIWVTLFSSNIERLNNIIEIADKYNKKIVFLGSSVQNYFLTAVKYNYINIRKAISLEEAANYKRNELLYIVTGSQGENNSFLPKVLQQQYKGLEVKKGDSVIFLSKPIPGNELKVQRIYNFIAQKEALLYTHEKYNLHVSGHGYVSQLELLMKTVEPKYVIPIHGETIHLKSLAYIANNLGIPSQTFRNGEIVLLDNTPTVLETIPFKKLYFEGGRTLSLEDIPLKQRKRMMYDGVVTASIIIKKNTIYKDIRITTIGLLTVDEQNNYLPNLNKLILKLNKELSKKEINNLDIIKPKIRSVIKKFFMELLKKKPIINLEVFYY